MIFSDATLIEMAQKMPVTLEDMSHIRGIGEFKLNKYGSEFFKCDKKIRVIDMILNIYIKILRGTCND